MLTAERLGKLASASGLTDPSVVLRGLAGDALDLALDPGRPLYPASMIKTPLAVATLLLAAGGEVDPAARIVVTEANMTANDAESPLVPGYAARIDELVELMISRSDNVATNVLIDVAGRERATRLLHGLGFSQTAVRRKLSGSDPLIDDPGATGRNAHPAADAAALFERLAAGALPHADALTGALARQRWNAKLSRGLEPGDAFAHKTGDTSEVSHDGGILTTAEGRRYVLVVYTAMRSCDETDDRFAAFMSALRPHLADENRRGRTRV